MGFYDNELNALFHGYRPVERKKLQLGDISDPCVRTCQYGMRRPLCGLPATRHFFWFKTSSTSAACDEHAAYIHTLDTTDKPFDEHTFGPNCNMPGTMWHTPYADEDEGYCFFPAPDDASTILEAITKTEAGNAQMAGLQTSLLG